MTTVYNPPAAAKLSPSQNGQPVPAPGPTQAEAASRRRARRRLAAIGGLAVVTLVGAWVAGSLPRWHQEKAVDAAAAEVASSRPQVTVAVARPASPTSERV